MSSQRSPKLLRLVPMEFYEAEPVKDGTSTEAFSFHGCTLLVPAVSIGAVGQLALDAVIMTAIEKKKCRRVGYLRSRHMLSIAGEDAFGLQQSEIKRRPKRKKQDPPIPSESASNEEFAGIALNLELLHILETKLLVLHVRAPAIKVCTQSNR